ncbi:hypothetical protein [Rossellomorea sp. FM04394]|uniref:hypothetical protein n=1 Tax=Rossellomorea sp. FM04394 TaxID=3243076 RepID=UPI0035A7287A
MAGFSQEMAGLIVISAGLSGKTAGLSWISAGLNRGYSRNRAGHATLSMEYALEL